MVIFDSDRPRKGRPEYTLPRDDWSRNYPNSLSTPPQRRSLTAETSSFRLMDCFDTPPDRTIFGTKNSEHWDSFQNKYCSGSSKNAAASRKKTTKRSNSNHQQGTRQTQRATMGRRRGRRNNKTGWLRILLGCWFPRTQPSSRCETTTSSTTRSRYFHFHWHSGDDEEEDGNNNHYDYDYEDETPWNKKNIPLVERYSEYFERRTAR
jgi:hypothetical protein